MVALVERISGVRQRTVEAVRARGKYGALPPGPPQSAVAQTLEWLAKPVPFLRRCRERYGHTFTVRLVGIAPFVMLTDHDAVKDVFTGPPDQLFAGEANVVLEPILGHNSVLLLDGERHMSQRRLLLPPFHGQRMRAYGAAIRDATRRSLQSWPRGRSFPVHDHTQAITLEVILRTVFGVDETKGAERGELERALAELLEGIANPIWLLPWARIDLGPRSPGGKLTAHLAHVDSLLLTLIRERRAQERSGREDVLSMLLDARHEDGSAMSDQELRDELMTLLVAGHETTATSLAWTMHRLLKHPEAMSRAVREVDEVFGVGGEIDPGRVGELEWIDAVCKETLRLNPVIPLVGRRLQRPMTLGGVSLPAGVVAVPALWLVHHDERHWPDAERFDPERFMGKKPSPYSFFPFGGGVRRCIGMAFALYEMQVVLATILSQVRLLPAPGEQIRLIRRAITFAPSGGMPLVALDR